MILSGTVAITNPFANIAGQPATIQVPADDSYVSGFSPVGNGQSWKLMPDGITAVAAPAYAPTVTIDWSTAGQFNVVLTGNVILAFANATVGQTVMINLTQDGTGNRLLTAPAGAVFANNSRTLSTAAGAIDTIIANYAAQGLYLCQLIRGYA